MSRLAKKPIPVPAGVTVSYEGGVFSVKGPKGELTRTLLGPIKIEIKDNEINLSPKDQEIFTKALLGTFASHIKNMIGGVLQPYEKKLILEGVGYKSDVKGKNLELALGFSHGVTVPIPEGVSVTAEKNVITFIGINKELVTGFAAKVRAMKKPEPYKGKGFRYDSEVIRRKQGKKTA